MEMHHKLRRDPTWHKDACNLCGQLGHQAANCSSGTVNWRQIFGDNAFVDKAPQYWSEELAARKAKQVDIPALEKRAKEYAKNMAEQAGLDYEEMMKKAEELHNQDPSVTIPKVTVMETDEAPLPAGWASAQDQQGRTYYYHKKSMKTQWDRPTEETPVS